MVKDVVCGMMVDEKNPPARTVYKGKDYYFCHQMCKEEFEAHPEDYVGEEKNDENE
jgi:YHS domain-containing protein